MNTLRILIKKEMIQFRRNKFLPKLLVMLPIMLVLVMPLVTQMDVKNVNVAFIDHDHSSLSERILSHIEHSEYFVLQTHVPDYAQALSLLDDNKVDIIVTIPESFERDLTNRSPSPIAIVANAVNSIKGGQGMQYMMQTIMGTIQEIQGESGALASNLSPDKVITLSPNNIAISHYYNPTGNYRFFMLPALMIIVLLLFSLFLPLLNMMQEKEHGTIEQINVTPVSRLQFILAKLLPYWMMCLVMLAVSMLFAWVVYGLSPAGSAGCIFLGAFLFATAMSGFALTIANISDNMHQAIFVLFFFMIIFMLMSGLFTPIDSMPQWAYNVTYAFPTRYIVNILRSVYLKGTLFVELGLDYIMLIVLSIFFNTLATLTYKKQN